MSARLKRGDSGRGRKGAARSSRKAPAGQARAGKLAAFGFTGFVVLMAVATAIALDIPAKAMIQAGEAVGSAGFRVDGYQIVGLKRMDRGLVEYCILHHEEDWVNHIFLSCRFEAERKGQYNEFLYSFFKLLSPERVQYAEGYYAEQRGDEQLFELEGHMIQRRCPHLKADLTRFGEVNDGILTCTLHGWQFEIATGRCLTSDDARLFSKKIECPAVAAATETASADD